MVSLSEESEEEDDDDEESSQEEDEEAEEEEVEEAEGGGNSTPFATNSAIASDSHATIAHRSSAVAPPLMLASAMESTSRALAVRWC